MALQKLTSCLYGLTYLLVQYLDLFDVVLHLFYDSTLIDRVAARI